MGSQDSLLALWSAGRRAEASAEARARLAQGQGEPAARRADALLLLSLEAEDAGDRDTALARVAEATRLEPRHYHARRRHAYLLTRAGQLDQGLALAQEVVRHWPNQAASHLLLARCLVEADRHEDAKLPFLRTVGLAPDNAPAHLGLGECLLTTGDWLPGWREYVWQARLPVGPMNRPRFQSPPWNGMRDPTLRLTIFADQGFGDCIQFCRFVPRIAPRVGRVTMAGSPKLAPLLGRLSGVADYTIRPSEMPEADAHCNLSDLPLLLGVEEADLAPGEAYLPLITARREAWQQRLVRDAGQTLKVGLCWSGNTSTREPSSSPLDLAALAPLAALQGVTFFSLQYGAEPRQLAAWPAAGAPLIDLTPEMEGFDETAHAVAALDLVVTIDTVTSHLGGATGTPTWTLLDRVASWRHLLNREASPWYGSMRLFRQDETRTWQPVVASVTGELAAVLRGERARLRPAA